ncbi:hypothetical protein NP493_153g10017 [Ridgeia piscesae]|uniref:Dimethyladenosine transferase 2, mitochondrial n=1 Tax=Ridgeia piscesae TaxID=27915 RepID=A0AAD9P484_RIDPI|nr:hypothetical protein NP493_153g10017 [Ridgeia piscesae]
MDKTRIRSTLWTLMKHTCQMNFTVGSCHQTIRSLSAVHYCHGGNKHSSHLPTTQKQQCFVQPRATLLSNIHSHCRHWLQYRGCHTSVLHHQYYSTVFIDSVPRLHLHRRCYRSVTDQSRMKSPQSKQTNVLVDKDWAKKIVSVLKEHFDVSLPNTVIFDSNAGSGVLSSELLKQGAPRVVIWEGRDKFWDSLKRLEDTYGDRVLLQKKCFFRSKKYAQTVHQEVPGQPYRGVPVVSWHQDSPLTVVGCTNTLVMTTYIMSLTYSLVGRTGLSFYGRVQHFLLLTGMEVKLLSDLDACWSSMIMTRILFYKIFFDFEIISKVPVSAFSPPHVLCGWKKTEYDADHMYLTRLVLKKDVYETVCAQSDMMVFLNMLGELSKRKHERLIPLLDHWFPGFGLTLLQMGYTMMDRVKSVSIDDITRIHKVVLTCPSYSESGFRQAVKDHGFSQPEEEDHTHSLVHPEEVDEEFYHSDHL